MAALPYAGTAAKAKEGKTVVRLKGGDPFIFGRGGEEVESLQAAGIQVAVVNGITAGLAAVTSLGVPLTHRQHAHGVVFVTGHAKPGDVGTDWRALADTATSWNDRLDAALQGLLADPSVSERPFSHPQAGNHQRADHRFDAVRELLFGPLFLQTHDPAGQRPGD